MPRIGCLRIPHFPAWTLRRASATNKGVLVTQSGCIIAASRDSRRRGVRIGMSCEQAARLAPSSRVCPREAELEEAMWDDVLSQLYQTTPRVSAERVGVAYFEPHAMEKSDAVVRRLNAQAALAPARSLAKLGAYRAGAGHTIILDAPDVRPFLRQFQTAWLPEASAVPTNVAERLTLFGYRTLGDLAGLEEKHLRAQFGATGKMIYRLLHPETEERVGMMTPLPCVKKQHVFERDAREPAVLRPALGRLVEAASRHLGSRHCQRVEVRLRVRSGRTHIRSRVLRGLTAEASTIAQQATILLDKLLSAFKAHQDPPPAVRSLKLVLGALRRPAARQGTLFAERPDVQGAVQAVHRRYPGAIMRALTHAHAVFDEDRFHLEPLDVA